jgi:hypothetical protein
MPGGPAMDRRRFIPLSNVTGQDIALEQRTLLSTTTSSILGAQTATVSSSSNLPQNLQQRLQRIQNLPFFMTTYQPNRSLPASVTTPIQDDLRALISRLHSPPSSVLEQFNLTIRSVSGHESLSKNAALSLVNAFDSMLGASGITGPLQAKFKTDMTNLANLDSYGPNPTKLAINDFGLIAQLTQAVGQPFNAPGDPSLSAADRVGKDPHTTRNPLPTFVGNAPDGVYIRIVDAKTKEILGVSGITTGGRYSTKLSIPLPVGHSEVQAQTLDSGYESIYSHRFAVHVLATK